MHIAIAGGTGFLGQALVHALNLAGHDVVVMTRRPQAPHDVLWNPNHSAGPWVSVVQNADVVVNLAGESIMGRRWTPARKQALLESRVEATRALASAVATAERSPVFISGSAVGFYGTHRDEPLTETAPPGHDFLAGICQQWERAADDAERTTRVVLLRTGIVLGRSGGALPELARPFKLFAGGPIGSGRQVVSWIHLDDWVHMTIWAMTTAAVAGPLNVTAPAPLTNAELADALGRALHRPAFVPAPAFAVRLALGEMAASLLEGQRVIPAKAQALGYRFTYPDVDGALAALFRRRP